jgi:glycoside/pentoside/hexuronide:cation symporter, GPH family
LTAVQLLEDASMSSRRTPLAVLMAYGMPGLPAAALGVPLYIFLPTFYTAGLGLPLAAVGTALLVARLWDVVTDPLVGALSDRTHSRFGRRRPWLIASLPLLMVSVWMLFRPIEGAGVGYLTLWSLALYLGWTMLSLPHGAWGAELSDNYHERSRITAAREIAVVLGTLVAAGLPAALQIDGDSRSGAVLAVLAPTLVVGLPVAVLIAIIVVPDRPVRRVQPVPWRRAGALLAANRPFRRLIVAYLVNGTANGLPATLFLLFVAHVLAEPEMQGPLLFAYFFCGIVGVPGWLVLARRIGKHRTWCFAMAANCAVFVWAPLLGAGDVWPFLVICVLSGLCLGADLVLPSAIQADVIDVDTAAGGGRRTGVYFAFWGMATKLALALAVGVAFPLLDLAGFTADGLNEPSALLTLALLYSAVPVVFKVFAITLMWRFPLDEAAQSDLKRRIQRIEGETVTES